MRQNRNKNKNYNFGLSVTVENGNFNRALKQFKRKVKDSGKMQELKDRQFYEKPSSRKQRKKQAAVRRTQKALTANEPKRY